MLRNHTRRTRAPIRLSMPAALSLASDDCDGHAWPRIRANRRAKPGLFDRTVIRLGKHCLKLGNCLDAGPTDEQPLEASLFLHDLAQPLQSARPGPYSVHRDNLPMLNGEDGMRVQHGTHERAGSP